jgi:hypothetical protein
MLMLFLWNVTLTENEDIISEFPSAQQNLFCLVSRKNTLKKPSV